VTSWSGGAETLLGYATGEIIGKPLADLLAPEGNVRHRSGRLLNAHAQLFSMQDGEGRIGSLAILVPGEAARKASESADLMRLVFDQQPLGLAVYDLDV
jgi:hypothetical protein